MPAIAGRDRDRQGSNPVSQENSTLGKFDAASIFPRKFDRLNFLKRQFFLRIYGRL